MRYGEAVAAQHFVPIRILLHACDVDGPVYFNDQIGRMAIEVGYVPMNNLLTTEVKAAELASPQSLPKQILLRRLFLPELFGRIQFLGLHMLTSHDSIVHLFPHCAVPPSL